MPKLALRPLAAACGILCASVLSGCAPLMQVPIVQKAVAVATFDPLPPDPALGTASAAQERAAWLEVGHPLATGITSAKHGPIAIDGLVAAAREHDVVWIGVEPNNPQAYRFAARYLRALARAQLTAPLVVAAVPREAEGQLHTAFAGSMRQRAWALSDSLPWEEFGADDPVVMPGMMEPVFRAAIEARYPMVAGGYSRAKVRAFALEGREARATPAASSIGLDYAWHQTRERALAAALVEEHQHCPAPPPVSDARVLIDRVESGGVAANVMSLLASSVKKPALIVVTELRHGRVDVGAPHTLQALALRQGRTVKQFTVGIQEADWSRSNVAQYREEIRRHDAVWFTEPVYDENVSAPARLCGSASGGPNLASAPEPVTTPRLVSATAR